MADKSILEDFEGFVFNRAFIAGHEQIKSDPEYHEKSEEFDKVFHAIQALLGDSCNLLLRLEEAENSICSVIIKHTYMIGLKDGIQIKNILGLED